MPDASGPALFLLGVVAGALLVVVWRSAVTAERLGTALDALKEHIGAIMVGTWTSLVVARSLLLGPEAWTGAVRDLSWLILAAGVALGADRAGLGFQRRQEGQGGPNTQS